MLAHKKPLARADQWNSNHLSWVPIYMIMDLLNRWLMKLLTGWIHKMQVQVKYQPELDILTTCHKVLPIIHSKEHRIRAIVCRVVQLQATNSNLELHWEMPKK